MEKEYKTLIVCMNCLNSRVLPKQDVDPDETRLIVMLSCPKCDAEGD